MKLNEIMSTADELQLLQKLLKDGKKVTFDMRLMSGDIEAIKFGGPRIQIQYNGDEGRAFLNITHGEFSSATISKRAGGVHLSITPDVTATA